MIPQKRQHKENHVSIPNSLLLDFQNNKTFLPQTNAFAWC